MLKKRHFRIKYITRVKRSLLDLDKKEGVLIKYDGNKQMLPLK
jgi:hypothetical protein